MGLFAIHAILVLALAISLSGRQGLAQNLPTGSQLVCLNASVANTARPSSVCSGLAADITVHDVVLEYNGGRSGGHTFVVNPCTPTSRTPSNKDRSIRSSPTVNCTTAYATQFGAPSSWVSCEAAYNIVVEPCTWVPGNVSTTPPRVGVVRCVFGEQRPASGSSDGNMALLVLLLSCATADVGPTPRAVATTAGGVPPTITLEASLPQICSCGVSPGSRGATTAAVVADVLVSVVVTAVVVAVSYSIGHNYFVKGLRGWEVLPCSSRFRRRSAHAYDAVNTQEDDDDAQGDVAQ